MIVPSPFTLPYDKTISNILKAGSLGSLLYIEVWTILEGQMFSPSFFHLTWQPHLGRKEAVKT